MTTVTIPAELAERRDLVAVPRGEFEEFVAWQKKRKSARTFSPTASEKKALARARRNRAGGNYVTLHDLCRLLETAR